MCKSNGRLCSCKRSKKASEPIPCKCSKSRKVISKKDKDKILELKELEFSKILITQNRLNYLKNTYTKNDMIIDAFTLINEFLNYKYLFSND